MAVERLMNVAQFIVRTRQKNSYLAKLIRHLSINPSGTKGGGGSKTTPLGFSSVVFARGMILKRNFG